MARTPKVTPTYLEGDKPLKIAMRDVVRALKMIEDAQTLDKFLAASSRRKAHVLVDPATVNFIKDFVLKNKLHVESVGKHIVNAKGLKTDPYGCDFGKD